MRDGGTVLALDLAAFYGLAEGAPGSVPMARSGRFAPAGAAHAAVGGEAIKWFNAHLSLHTPAAIFIERPHLGTLKRGTTSFDVVYRLLGLAYTFQSVAYLRGVYDCRLVKVEDIRHHFIGHGNLKGDRAKALVQRRCQDLGWAFRNPDEADALALWAYGCEQLKPGSGHAMQPGFNFAAAVALQERPSRPRKQETMSAREAAETLFKKRK